MLDFSLNNTSIAYMLQNTKKKFKDMSIKRLQKKAGWGDSTLDMILMADF